MDPIKKILGDKSKNRYVQKYCPNCEKKTLWEDDNGMFPSCSECGCLAPMKKW